MDDTFLHQLGNGFYMTNMPASWEGDPLDWYCVIEADTHKIIEAPKIFIPEFWDIPTEAGPERMYLWSGVEGLILEYIGSKISHPKEAIRFGWILFREWELQMLIPTDLLNDDKFDLWGECFETKDELRQRSNENIEWTAWTISGNPGYPSDEGVL
ncbi:hypothetical protein MBM_01312 [Drepanopeziza brunnea f. sp. 'multigermtubi' MB_m1]|uniref:Uncharacterized protein n=2 Tax=Drepanopeziza brunnea f. sp. 'multigermtubi' TaxID=698441 RepID=K1WSQ1_MARBU|nr:uncharacterized protein MBM_01312 [Drepanopeziza brunnea f. sp. 'multigermtubi' MB_m1]EKD20630.1 hypothetical protein MBM_01312 [Drepanopeziza brunnea f. sp. 'multigermtubi' MB_m1]